MTAMMYPSNRIANLGLVAVGLISVIAAMKRATPSAGAAAFDPAHARYSPLSEITAKNVAHLKPVWVYDTGAKGRGWQVSPLVVEGAMYISIPGGAAALDPERGKQLWIFKPTDLTRPGRDRGVAYWPGDGSLGARIIYTIADRMYALDAKTGQPIPDFGNKGMVNLRDGVADKYPNG
jgi:quinoprotein glucose dehydrogenase